jgi:glycosyltransferase involved in cell wall biosynthesis
MNENEFTPERIAKLDKVIVLSQYHRGLFPMIPDDKILMSANGIDPEDFEALDTKIKRDPHRLIYTSSHVRGLQLVYEIWPEVKKAVPDAKLDIYYGWGSFDAVNRDNPERMEWKQKMIEWSQELDGVTDHGKIGQDQMVEELMGSGIWVYPCPFPEIYAIAAVKAQAAGAVPVSSDFAALDETVQFGAKIHMSQMDEKTPIGEWNKKELEEFKIALIGMLKHPKKQEKIRPEMMKWARTKMTWGNTAKGWIEEFTSED